MGSQPGRCSASQLCWQPPQHFTAMPHRPLFYWGYTAPASIFPHIRPPQNSAGYPVPKQVLKTVCVCMHTHMHTYMHRNAHAMMWKSQDNLQRSVLSFHHVGLRDGTQAVIHAWWPTPLHTEPSLWSQGHCVHPSFRFLYSVIEKEYHWVSF